jgi:mono/diheme cytochrome c family protein
MLFCTFGNTGRYCSLKVCLPLIFINPRSLRFPLMEVNTRPEGRWHPGWARQSCFEGRKTMRQGPIAATSSGLLALLALVIGGAGEAGAQASVSARGEAIARQHCARCHAVGAAGQSPMGLAPPFRDLARRYPVEFLAEALAEGIVTGHPAMPRFVFEPREIDALLTYMESLGPGRR